MFKGGNKLKLSSKKYAICFLAIFLMLSPYKSVLLLSKSAAEDVEEDLEQLIQNAAGGRKHALYQFARSHGDASWFALALVAEKYGYPVLATKLRVESYRNDPDPFRTLSLTTLLAEDPRSVSQPLSALRQAEKRLGPREDIREARIAVLSERKKKRALLKELPLVSGKSWETPIFSGLSIRDEFNISIVPELEHFILFCEDPQFLNLLMDNVEDYISPHVQFLLRARKSFALGDFVAALPLYSDWFDVIVENPAGYEMKTIAPVFTEIVHVASQTKQTALWAHKFKDSVEKMHQAGQYATAYSAGQLYRIEGLYDTAAESFILAASLIPEGLERDQAIWRRFQCLYEAGQVKLDEELEVFSWAAEIWDRPERFTDYLENFIHLRISRRQWDALWRQYQLWGERWPDNIRAMTAAAFAFAAEVGKLSGISAEKFLEAAIDAAPLSWWGLRAAGILERDIVLTPRVGIATETGKDRVVQLLLDWNLEDIATEAVDDDPHAYSDKTIRYLAQSLAEDKPRLSIRIIGILWQRSGYSPDINDLLLRYPLPYEKLTRDAALSRNLPPYLFFGLIRTESAWDVTALSRSGAQGLTQFMPETWDEWVRRLKYPQDTDPMDPAPNLVMGASYLRWLWEREWTSGWLDVLISYNAGGSRLKDWTDSITILSEDLFSMSIPIKEPRQYSAKVFAAATLYGYLYSDTPPGDLHKRWGLRMY